MILPSTKTKPCGLVLWRGGGGNVAVVEDVKVAAIGVGCGRADDKVHVTPDVAIDEVMPATVHQNGIPPIEEEGGLVVSGQREPAKA